MTALLAVLLAALNGVRDTLPLLCAAALHEAGHLCACLLLRVPVRFFRPSPVGAVIGYDPTAVSYEVEAVIAAAGPLFGLLGTAAACLSDGGRSAALFGVSSLSLSLFNLLPLRPLDGGVLLSALLCRALSPERSDRILSRLTAAGTIFLWMCAVAVQLRCGGNLSLLLLSIYMLTSLAAP